jgi:predicted RNA binding protein YcfA (HicA-like mRNA interferase family)
MVRFLQLRGFAVARIRGSHHVLQRGAVHGSETLRIGTLRGILRDIEMSPAEFVGRWKR